MNQRIKFTKQHKPVRFGDLPGGRTVEGRRLAARRAAETRRYNNVVKETKEAEEAANWWPLRAGEVMRNAGVSLGWKMFDFD
jgi:hypothetical protein